MSSEPVWKQMANGGLVTAPGSTDSIRTGDWRNEMPIIDLSRCTHCMICWVDCPDASFVVADAKLISVDLEHCKGCGICAEVCPVKCISMVPDTPATRENGA